MNKEASFHVERQAIVAAMSGSEHLSNKAGAALVQLGKVERPKKEEHKGNFKKHKRCDKKVAHHQNLRTQLQDNARLVEIGLRKLNRDAPGRGSVVIRLGAIFSQCHWSTDPDGCSSARPVHTDGPQADSFWLRERTILALN
jgi:hypothetical protein